MPRLSIVLANIRSCYNVGSIFRSADGFGISHIYIAGYTPYPKHSDDSRLPHLANKISASIHKTALGAENNIHFSVYPGIYDAIEAAKTDGYEILALEQANNSTPINQYVLKNDSALIIGNEVDGLDKKILDQCQHIVEIPMVGKKESFNAAVSAAIAMFSLKCICR